MGGAPADHLIRRTPICNVDLSGMATRPDPRNSLLSPEQAGEPTAGRDCKSLASNDLGTVPATPMRSITGNLIREMLALEQGIFNSGTGNCVHRTGSAQLASAWCRRRRRAAARLRALVVEGRLISATAVMVTWLNAGHDHPTRRHHGETRAPAGVALGCRHSLRAINCTCDSCIDDGDAHAPQERQRRQFGCRTFLHITKLFWVY